ncbi:MAG: response regulator [Desulfobacteraceae bacterium]|nr:response regulator [Desulfobacteraceae bacterium]
MENQISSEQEFLKDAPVVVARHNLDLKVEWATKACQKVAGLSPGQIIGQKCYMAWGLEESCIDCPVRLVIETGQPAEAQLPPANSGNRSKIQGFWLLKIVPVKDENGKVTGVIETAFDITEIKRMQLAFLKSESLLCEAQRLAHIGHWELDLQTEQLLWSDEIYRIFEICPSEFEASYEAFLRVIHPDDRKLVNKVYTESVKNKEPYVIDHRLLFLDGRIKFVQERCRTYYDDKGKPVRSLGTVQDITERKLVEEENKQLQVKFVQAQKMESVGRLAGGVAHDFNNMLCVILGHLDLVFDQIDSTHPLYSTLEQIQKAGQRSANLTRQLLAFARQQPIAPIILDLNCIVDDMLKILNRLLGEDIDLAWIPAADLGQVRLDPTQVDQILANLCVNARDAIVGVGKITIETQNFVFGEEYCVQNPGFFPGAYVMLAVSDNGCGMDQETLSRLFEPFFTTKKLGTGTGLGLATIYGIVKQNDGFINVYSEQGRGATFRIYLPQYEGECEEDLVEDVSQPIQIGTETILVVEDEIMILNFCSKMLEKFGYRVLTADNPADALRLAKKHGEDIDLLITDVVMTQMSGSDLASKLVANFPGLKILYMSGYTANVIAHHGILEDGIIFLQKPFAAKELAAKVRAAMI